MCPVQVNEDYAQYTNMGAAVTLICFVVCVLLFASEVVRPRFKLNPLFAGTSLSAPSTPSTSYFQAQRHGTCSLKVIDATSTLGSQDHTALVKPRIVTSL